MTQDLGQNRELSADHLPVAVFDPGVTDGGQNGHMLLELVHLPFEGFGHAARSGQGGERLGQLVQSPPHEVQLVCDFLGVQIGKRTCGSVYRGRVCACQSKRSIKAAVSFFKVRVAGHLPFIHSSDMTWKLSAVVHSCSCGCLSANSVWSIGN